MKDARSKERAFGSSHFATDLSKATNSATGSLSAGASGLLSKATPIQLTSSLESKHPGDTRNHSTPRLCKAGRLLLCFPSTPRCFPFAPQAAKSRARSATLASVAASLSSVSSALNRKLFDIPRLSPAHDIARQGPFKLAVVRGLWKFWFASLAPGGRYFLLATILFFFYGGLTLEAGAFVPLTYALAAWGLAFVARSLERPCVEVAARHADRIAAGERLSVDIEVRNLKASALSGALVVAHRLPDAIDTASIEGAALPTLESGGQGRVQLELSPRRRGRYQLRGFRVETAFPFGILYAARAVETRSSLLVYPKFEPLERLDLPQARRFQPGGVAFAAAKGESVEFIGNRDYRQGDQVRDIDWRATARLSRPIVREFREEYFLRAALVLDTHVPDPTPAVLADFERAVSLCAACGDAMNRFDYLVDILAAGPNLHHLLAGLGLASLDQVLDILAEVESTTQAPWDELVPALDANLEGVSSVVCLFLDWDETRRAFAHGLAQSGTAVKIVVVRDLESSGPLTLAPEGSWPGEIVVLGQAEFEVGVRAL